MAKQIGKTGNGRMYDVGLLKAAGISDAILRSAQIIKGKRNRTNNLEDFKKALRIVDEQDAVNRYVWHNLPGGITGQELERMIYYRGQLCLFYSKELENFYFMPYALDGTIDYYGRYNRIHPIPYYEGENEAKLDEEAKKKVKALAAILSAIKLDVVYDVATEPEKLDLSSVAVLLHDYTKQRGQEILPRQSLQDPVISLEAEAFPMARTAMIAGSGIKALRVGDASEKEEIEDANDQVYAAAMSGALFIPVLGGLDFQELGESGNKAADNYLMLMQAIDNFRLSLLGIDNGGIFQKKAHELQEEHDSNRTASSFAYEDGLSIRQNFCTVSNSLWGLGMWCDKPDNVEAEGNAPEQDEEPDGQEEEGGSADE